MTLDQVATGALGLFTAALGWFLTRLATKLDDVPKTYATKDEMNRLEDKVASGIRGLGDKVDAGFSRVYDKLDDKADKA